MLSLRSLHHQTPLLSHLPFASIRIITLILIANIALWLAVAAVLHFYPNLASSAVLAWTLGLRHALDADHISAIDLVTRRLVGSSRGGGGDGGGRGAVQAEERQPVSVGMWFSLGHSTIVVITTVLVAATTVSITSHFDAFSNIGGIIGSSVSTAFLLVLGAINGWLLWRGVLNLKRVMREARLRCSVEESGGGDVELQCLESEEIRMEGRERTEKNVGNVRIATVVSSAGQGSDGGDDLSSGKATALKMPDPIEMPQQEEELQLRNRSCLNTLLRWSMKLIDRPWKIYPLGVLFGLGFDTSSEIALLGITTLESSRGINPGNNQSGTLPASSIWAILIFPLLFTAGMCLLDTTDGALMYALYTSRAAGTSQLAVAYANVVLTGFTVFVAVGVGMLQMLNMLSNVLPQWRLDESPGFWAGVAEIGDRYDVIGGAVCAGFVIVAGCSWIGYRPWRRYVLKLRSSRVVEDE